MRSERPPPCGAPVSNGVSNGGPFRARVGTEKGGSLTSHSIFPVRPRVLWEDEGNSKGLNKMAEMEVVKL